MLKHVEYVLSAEFDLDTGPTVKFQYPQPIEGDERLMAELMLPDQIHSRTDDWTVFFLYKRPGETRLEYNVPDEDLKEAATKYYVLNLVNTKFDDALKRGALVRAMCIVTPHPFFQVFKPLLMLALDSYFKDPRIDHLATLYNCINSIDLSHGPKLTESEKRLMASTDYTSLFIEKFEEAQNEARARQQQQQQQSAVEEDTDGVSVGPADGANHGLSRRSSSATAVAPHQPSFYLDLKSNTRLTPSATLVARDTHYFDATAVFNGMKIPLKVPTDCFPESAGDFSLIRLINMLNAINQPFATLHPHLTIYGPHTPPLLVLIFGLLTQKRILFVGLNTPSREVSEHVLACCAMVSGSILRSFSTHAFPYTDLSKVDELLATPGYIAGVKNPAFGHHPQWWDIIIDIDNQTMKISPEIAQPQPLPPQPAGVTSSSPTIGSTMSHTSASSISSDNTLAPLSTTVTTSAASVSGGGSGGGGGSSSGHGHGHNSTQIAPEDQTFIDDLKSMLSKHFGEKAIRRRCQSYIRRFVRITTNYEEMRYGSTNLWPSVTDPTWNVCPGYGYSWAEESQRTADLQLYAPVIEGWRASLSYRYHIDDLRYIWPKPPKYVIDYGFHMDRIRLQQLSYDESAAVFEVLAKHTQDYDDVNRLLMATKSTSLFYIAFGLFHRDETVRMRVARLLSRIENHAAGRYYFQSISQFQKVAYKRILAEANKRSQNGVSF